MASSPGRTETWKNGWMSKVKTEFKKSPLGSNIIFGLIIFILEKFVEMEFECPCDPVWNRLFGSAFFIIPGALAFVLMCRIHRCKCQCDKECLKRVISCLFPAIVWVIVLFFDGHYFACAMTDWSGRYVIVDKAAPQKWCEPTNGSTQELMIKTQQWFFQSQGCGILCIVVIIIAVACSCCTKEETSEEEPRSIELM